MLYISKCFVSEALLKGKLDLKSRMRLYFNVTLENISDAAVSFVGEGLPSLKL